MRRVLVFSMFLVACPQNQFDDAMPFDGGFPVFDATTEASLFDSTLDDGSDATTFNGGGPFLCGQCICDGTLDMCASGGGGGGAPIADASADADAADADASDATPTCDPDAAPTLCTPIPIECLPKPTCACVEKSVGGGCTCSVDPSGNGLVVTCPPKP